MIKVLLSIILIITLSSSYNAISNLNNSLKDYKASKNLLGYGVLDGLLGDPIDHMKYNDQYRFLDSMKSSTNYFYSQFYDISLYSKKEKQEIESLGKLDNTYYFGTVDINYLIKEKINVYDLDNNIVNKNEIKDIYFIFPKNKKNIIEDFEKYYKAISDFYFSNIKRDYYFKAYLYDDTKIDTYRIEYNTKYLNSPIIRVVDDSYNIPYFIDKLGYSMSGMGLNTGFKIEVKDQDKVLKLIDDYSSTYGLTNMISSSSFTTYSDYFNNEIFKENMMLLIIGVTILFSLTTYIIMQKEYSLIYFNNNKKKIFVKKLMGFDNSKIYDNLYSLNFKGTILSIILSIIILLIINKFNFIILVLSIIIYLIIDYIIINKLIKNYDSKDIYIEIKGGNND